ncbi:hypothetical protein GRF59_26480 [Paenibacillus sp. HJL G12]|uniref:Uncharacterized protein n=1 Tax=Paenibacillus dendrobii TaxID=2691084 RepID=A0A7X3IPP0_9BACL|nr:hypothetical protein [Paenibacillus dendrobii]MWV47146.1 hypothetical protein [Paenibacillus dendrobii]
MKKKKAFSAILSLALVASIAMAMPVLASTSESPSVSGTKTSSLVFAKDTTSNEQEHPQISTGPSIEPYSNYVILDQAVSTFGHSWDQPVGYPAYRVYATNTRSEIMVMTVKYGSQSYSYDIAANSSTAIVVNNATSGRHSIDFTTKSGAVSGNVQVRVSDTGLQ